MLTGPKGEKRPADVIGASLQRHAFGAGGAALLAKRLRRRVLAVVWR